MKFRLSVKAVFKKQYIERSITEATEKELMRFGGYSMKIVQRSMKKAPKTKTKGGKKRKLSRYGQMVTTKSGKNKGRQRFQKGRLSQPGSPPFHRGSGKDKLRNIRFEYIKRTHSVSVFTMPYRSVAKWQKQTSGDAPSLLHEVGGNAAFIKKRRLGSSRSNRRPKQRRIKAKFPKRPYVKPGSLTAIQKWKPGLTNYVNKHTTKKA